jgi:VIT1/CCC1 family predicted Fe2+/Mn2+ transporter
VPASGVVNVASFFSGPSIERPGKARARLLDPNERIAEVLFGLIMVLTLTCSFSVATGDQTATRELMIAALGCNFAWGLIDGVFYLMTSFSERGRNILTLERLRAMQNFEEARALVVDAFPPLIASLLTPADFERIRSALAAMVGLPTHPYLTKDDWLAALGVFLLVFLSTLPVVIPLWLVPDARVALRVSNGVAIVMLFLAGYAFGRYAMRRRWWATGLAMVALGGVLVAITIRLGG